MVAADGVNVERHRALLTVGPLVASVLDPNRALVLHCTSHLPGGRRTQARFDWSWAFVLRPMDRGQRTRFLFRSQWTTAPWWLTLGGWLGIVPADFVMSRDMLRGFNHRAEQLADQRTASSEVAA